MSSGVGHRATWLRADSATQYSSPVWISLIVVCIRIQPIYVL